MLTRSARPYDAAGRCVRVRNPPATSIVPRTRIPTRRYLSDPGNAAPVVVNCHATCSQGAVIEALKGRGLWPDPSARRASPTNGYTPPKRWAAYYASNGEHAGDHCRLDTTPKRMWWDPSGVGTADLALNGARELPAVGPVVLVEGEKARDA